MLVSLAQDKNKSGKVGGEKTAQSYISLDSQLSVLASGDDDLIGQTITNLAKTGDTRLEEFLSSTGRGAFITGQPTMEKFGSLSIWRL